MNHALETNTDEEGYFEQRSRQVAKLPTSLRAHARHPKNALIELTNGCNHACIFCKNSNQGRKAAFLPLDTYRSFVEQAVSLGLEEIGLYATGEPFMTKNLHDYIRIAKQAGVRRVYLTTNGALATLERVQACVDAGLDSMKFSINASNQQDYNLVHGFDDFEKVMQNLHSIHEWRDANKIDLQLLCSCVIIPSVGDIQQEHSALFSRYFDDIVYVEAGSQAGQAFELIDELAVSPHGVFGNINQENTLESIKPCSMVWNRYHLTAEGYLAACCVDYELDLVYSNLNDESLEQGWNNAHAKKLRNAHIDGNLEGLLCHQCMLNKKQDYHFLLAAHLLTK